MIIQYLTTQAPHFSLDFSQDTPHLHPHPQIILFLVSKFYNATVKLDLSDGKKTCVRLSNLKWKNCILTKHILSFIYWGIYERDKMLCARWINWLWNCSFKSWRQDPERLKKKKKKPTPNWSTYWGKDDFNFASLNGVSMRRLWQRRKRKKRRGEAMRRRFDEPGVPLQWCSFALSLTVSPLLSSFLPLSVSLFLFFPSFISIKDYWAPTTCTHGAGFWDTRVKQK